MADFTEGDEAVKRGRARLPYGPNNDPHMPSPPPEPRMSEPTKRFDPADLYSNPYDPEGSRYAGMEQDPNGDYVCYEDFTLATQRAEAVSKQRDMAIAGFAKAESECKKLRQRAEAAEAERDEVMRCCRGTRMDDAALTSIREYVAEKLRIEAERDALRRVISGVRRKALAEVDRAIVEGERYSYSTGSEPMGVRGGVHASVKGDLCDLRHRMLIALDAALAVQPTTEGL